MSYDPDDMVLEIARMEREAVQAIARKIAAQQLGEAFIGIEEELAALKTKEAA